MTEIKATMKSTTVIRLIERPQRAENKIMFMFFSYICLGFVFRTNGKLAQFSLHKEALTHCSALQKPVDLFP